MANGVLFISRFYFSCFFNIKNQRKSFAIQNNRIKNKTTTITTNSSTTATAAVKKIIQYDILQMQSRY